MKTLAELVTEEGVDILGNRMIRCSIHEDKTPSCHMDLDKGLWRCVGCGASWSAIDWLMKVRGMSNREALDAAEPRDGKAGPGTLLFRYEKWNSGKGVAVHGMFVSPDGDRVDQRIYGPRVESSSNLLVIGGWPGQR